MIELRPNYEMQSLTIRPKEGSYGPDWKESMHNILKTWAVDPTFQCIAAEETGGREEKNHMQIMYIINSDDSRRFKDQVKTACRKLKGCDLSSGIGKKNHTYVWKNQSSNFHMFGYPLKEFDSFEDLLILNVEDDLEELKAAVDLSFKLRKPKVSAKQRLMDILDIPLNYLMENEHIHSTSPDSFIMSQLQRYLYTEDKVEDYNIIRRNEVMAKLIFHEVVYGYSVKLEKYHNCAL